MNYTLHLRNKKRKTGGPDGLEAWCVALSASFINFVMAGLGRMSGILYVAFIDIFQVDRLQASVPFSVRSLTRNLLGPVVGIVGQKYGVRAATLMGGVIGTLSAAACSYANGILWITATWGAINGIGTALTITLPQVVLNQHFKEYRTTASGMAYSGGCVGSFMFPALLEYLLHTYGLGGTFLILSGIIMNVIPAAMMLKKPSWLNNKPKRKVEVSTISYGADNRLRQSFEQYASIGVSDSSKQKCVRGSSVYPKDENDDGGLNLCQKSDMKDCNLMSKSRIHTEFLRQNNRLITLLLSTNFADTDKHNIKSCSCLSLGNLHKELDDLYHGIEDAFSDNDNSIRHMAKGTKYSKDTDSYSESDCSKIYPTDEREIGIKNQRHIKLETKECILLLLNKLLKEDMNNIITLFPEDEHRNITKIIEQLRYVYHFLKESEQYREISTCSSKQNACEKSNEIDKKDYSHSNTFSAHIRTAFRLHTNPIFLLISLCRSVHFLTFVPAVTIIVDFSMDKGLLEEDGKYVIAALSFGDLMGRLCLGWVTDKEYMGLPRYMLFVMVMQGACTASLSLMHSKTALLSVIAIFGLLQGSLFVRHPVLVSKYLGSHEQSVAMGCFNFFSGLLGFTLPNYIGYFRDTIGSYDYIFYINGAIGAFVGIMWFFEPYFVKCIKPDNAPNEQPTL